MDTTALVEADVETGRRAVELFDQDGVDARAAFWLYNRDAGEWWLTVATPLVDSAGPRVAYERVARALKGTEIEEQLPLRRIQVISPNAPLIHLLRSVAKTGRKLTDVRITQNVVNNVLIEGAHVYRMT